MVEQAQHRLILSARSPFARRARLALARVGIAFDEEFVDVFNPPPYLRALNPLGQVPILIVPQCGALVDSSHIIEYAQQHAVNRGCEPLWPLVPVRCLQVRNASAQAVGIMTHVVAHFLERTRGLPEDEWSAELLQNVRGALTYLSANLDLLQNSGGQLTQAGWDTAVALEYMNLRLPLYDWRTLHLGLSEILDRARAGTDFTRTSPPA